MLSMGDVVLIVVTGFVAGFVAATWKRGQWPWERAGWSFPRWWPRQQKEGK
jgi:hypothetical protein